MVTNSPLMFPKPDFPILLLHQDDEDEKDSESYSRFNPAQAASALSILCEILERLPASAKVVVLCLYTAEKERMRDMLKAKGIFIPVVSADGFQANEADLVYIITTRSVEQSDDDRLLAFVKDDRRATVALSRARHGLILHGNLLTLSKGTVWRKFILEALKETEIVRPDSYLYALRSGTNPETITLPLGCVNGILPAPTPSSSFHHTA